MPFGFEISFPREYLRATLIVSLLSVWVLVFLFYYLNRYTKRNYFTIWTAAWLFYALWLTLSLSYPSPDWRSFTMVLKQWCVGISATFLFWGSLEFLGAKVRQTLFGLFIGFLLTWSYLSPEFLADPLLMQLPIFTMVGLASMFAAFSFYRFRQRRQFVGVGLLVFGFFLWGIYLTTYPFSIRYEHLFSVGFLISAVLQLFIAVSMIVLVLEEARYLHEQVLQQIQSVKSEKEALQLRVLNAEEQFQGLMDKARLNADLQKAYDELRQTQQSVMQQERLRAVGQMASGIAHDINNALSPVMAFAELLLKHETNLSSRSQKHLQHIRTAAEDIAHLVARMNEFYRRREQKEQLRLVNLNRLVEQVIDLTRPRWQDIPQRRGVTINVFTELDEKLPQLWSNESEVREGLINLLLNSVDALPKGGDIVVSIRGLNLTHGVFGSEAPTHIVLELRDNGIGMDDKTRERCLEPFFSTKRDQGGTGLGLAMVYGMVERHQGSLEVESQLGRGTKVRLVFPLREAVTGSDAASKPVYDNVPLNILCIDDEPLLRELLLEGLQAESHRVRTADGGQAGIEHFRTAKKDGQPFDLVITDLGMPHLDGRKVAQAIKAEAPSTPVILLTGWGVVLQESGERLPEVDAVLSKPPRLGELIETVAKVAATRKKAA